MSFEQWLLTSAAALNTIRAGGLLVFTTETFYGLGGNALSPETAAALVRIKGRPMGKPMPLLLGTTAQLTLVASNPIAATAIVAPLAAAFWPGPLTICIPAADWLPAEVVDAAGLVAVRVSGHPLARQLCLQAGTALIASSANPSGYPPVARPEDLDLALLAATAGLLDGPPAPAGGSPSTIVVPEDPYTVRLLRDGAVSRQALAVVGFRVLV